jgi:homoserine O-acetyltransferase
MSLTASPEIPACSSAATYDYGAASPPGAACVVAAPVARAAFTPAVHGTDPQRLALRYAGERRVDVRWALHGAPDRPLVVALGGISANRHVCASSVDASDGWWQTQVGPRAAIDTTRHAVLSIDWLGADGSLDMPIDSADQADAIAALLDLFGVERAHAFVGASYGAMVALQFAARHAARVGHTIAISGADRSHPHTTALRVIQRRIAELGRRAGCGREALSLARQLAMLGYRTPEELAQRFDGAPCYRAGAFEFAPAPWLDACGTRFVERFHPTAFLRLSESIDLHRVDPAQITGRVTLIGVEQDQIVPIGDLERLQRAVRGRCTLQRLGSIYGHDAFLKETTTIATLLGEALAGTREAA